MAKKKSSKQKNDEVLEKSNDEITSKQSSIKCITQVLNKIQLNKKQRELLKIINENKIIIITGPAGVSKTFSIAYYITDQIAKHNPDFEKYVLSKPIQEAGEKLGFLPGTVEEKIGPYFESYVSNFELLMPKVEFKKLLEKDRIKYEPLAYMRGKTFLKSLQVLDEAQNANWKQLMLFVTRMGKDSKCILMGDISQHDVHKDMLALNKFAEMMQHIPGVALFEFTREDNMREKIIQDITEIYERAKYAGELNEENYRYDNGRK